MKCNNRITVSEGSGLPFTMTWTGVNSAWGNVPLCYGETTERSTTHGWAEALNDALTAIWAAI